MEQSNGKLPGKTGAGRAEKDGRGREEEGTGKMTKVKIQGKLKKRASSC